MRKFKLKKLICLALVLVMLLSLSGCGLGSAITAAKAARAMSKLKSVSGELVLDLQLSAYGMEIPAKLSAPVDFVTEPFALQADTQLELMGQSVPAFRVFMEKDDAYLKLYLGTSTAALFGGTEVWTAQQTQLGDQKKLSVSTIMGAYTALSDSFSEAGLESVGDFNATRYDGVLSEKLVSRFFKGSGGLTVSGVKFTEEQLIDAFVDTSVSFWLDNDSHCLVKFQVELSRSTDMLFLGLISDALDMESEAGVDKAVLSFTVSDFDSVDKIIIPDEAKAALESGPPV